MRSIVTAYYLVFLLCVFQAAACHASTYRLVQASLMQGSGFGYSGTITTDGSLGIFTDTEFIASWSIRTVLPNNEGGSLISLLSPANSTLSLTTRSATEVPRVVATEDALFFEPMPSGTVFTELIFTGQTSILRITNRAERGTVGVLGSNSVPGFGVFRDDPVFARAVPEPSSLPIAALAGLVFLRRRA